MARRALSHPSVEGAIDMIDEPDLARVAWDEYGEERIARPVIKWAGGKRQLLTELFKSMAAFKSYGHYYEPFVGGGALFFAMRATGWGGAATLGDANERLIRTYMGIKHDVEGVIEILRKRKYDKREYLRERARHIDSADDAELAAWFIYLNKTGFNGLYRVNRAGEVNVPFGRYTNPTICDSDGLRAASRALQATVLKAGDFEKAVKGAEKGDLVYFDPPYWPASESANFTGYTKDGFGSGDQERLRDVAASSQSRGVHVILSNADVAPIRKLYKGFKIREVSARRAINSDASKRGKVGELIIT